MRHAALLAISMLLMALLGCVAPRPQAPNALPTGDSSRTSLDWAGVYSGTVPCASCAGIRTRIELREDGRYERSLTYLGENALPIVDTGRFTWDDSGSTITVGANRDAQQYQVGENVLFHLDRNGERITGDLATAYRLPKLLNDPRIENRHWRLVELNGRPIATPSGREGAYLELDGDQRRAAGNASCNRYFGTYELTAADHIRFGPEMGSTMMACPDLEIEREFLDALADVVSYTFGEGVLTLNDDHMAPLARFHDGGSTTGAR